MKFVDRDVCGSSNIGTIWLGDRVDLAPLSKQRVRAEKATR